MTPILTLTVLAFFQGASTPGALRAGCSASDEEVTAIRSTDQIEVNHAVAGGDGACYSLTLTRDGKTIGGYFLGDNLPVIASFVQEREKVSDVRLEAIASQPLPAPVVPKPAAGTEKPAPPAPPTEIFANFLLAIPKGKW